MLKSGGLPPGPPIPHGCYSLMQGHWHVEDHHAGVLNEILKAGDKEEVVHKNGFTLPQFLLCPIEVKVNIECFDEGGDGVFVGVGFLLDNFDQVLHDIAPGTLVDDNSG